MKTPIAIIGIGCRFPGASDGPEELWRLLTHGVDAVREIPADRWNLRKYYNADPARPGRTYARWGGFLDCVDQFDAAFFSMSPREAAKADPQQRLILEVAYEALEDSGQTVEGLSGKRGGVFVGISSYDYGAMQGDERDSIDAYTNLGSALSITANRVSYFFNLHGPSLAVDTACSSALVAVHLACQSMWNGEIELAFAGGVGLTLRPEPTIGFSKASMLAPDGRCKSFDAAANGYARAEGAGIVLLKPLPKAQADGDSIYAVIRSTAVNQDGRTGGISVPSADAQQAMLREALDHAGIAAQSVQYVEAHGTGTPVGDPIEAAAIGAVYGASRSPGQECLIGSIKSNFGHLEAASGAAGLIKAALAVQRGAIPATLHQVNPSPHIPFDDLKIRVVDHLTPWPDTGVEARRAGVNSFGFGGTNAHIILESAPAVEPLRSPPADGTGIARPMLIPVSARSPEALRAVAASYVQFLQDDTRAGASLADICHTAALRRSHHDHRLAVVANTTADLCDLLRGFVAGESSSMCHAGRRSSKQGVVFVCSGMGQQWWAMGRQLLAEERGYRDAVGRIDEVLGALAGWSLLRELEADEQHTRINETRVAQPAIFATQVGIAAVLKQWGIQPSAIMGHSVGEVAAAYLAGALSLEDAVKVTYHRSRLQQRTAGLGTMLAAGVSSQEANRLINGYDGVVSVGAINSAESVTLSGDSDVLRAIAQELDARGVFCRALNVEVPYHSPTMDTLRSELLDSLGDLRPRATSVPLYSTVTGELIDGTALSATYWWQNVRQPVQFHQAMSSAIEAGPDVFMEIGAHPVLGVSIAECLREHDRNGVVVPSLRRGQPENATLLASVGRLYTLGATIDWRGVTRAEGTFVKLPTYSWQRERHWHESDRIRRERLGEVVHPLLGMRSESAEPRWLVELDLASLPFLADHRVQGTTIFPAAGYVEMGLAVAHELFGAAACVVEDLEFRKALFLSDKASSTIEVAVQRSSHTFEVSTLMPGSDAWTGHAGGKVRALPAATRRNPLDLDAIRARCQIAVSGEECYRRFQVLGLEYGPAFQPIAQLWQGAQEAIAEIRLHDVEDDQDELWLHPALLDGLFQVILGTVAGGQEAELYLPVRIDRVEYHAPPGARAFGYARLRERNGNEIIGDLVLADEQGARLVEVRGFTCRTSEIGKETSDRSIYQYQWRLKARATERPADVRSAAHLPRPSELEPVLAAEAAVLRQRWRRDEFYGERDRLLHEMAAAYIFEGLTELGWDPVRDVAVPVAALAEQLGVVPEHQRLFARLLERLTSEGNSSRRAEDVWRQIWRQYPDAMSELSLMGSCGRHLAGVLRGDVNPLELIFPEGSSVTAEHLYQDSPVYRVYNQLVQKAVSEIVRRLPDGRTLRVLEIGGGTGGLSAFVLPKLPLLRTQYTFTDIGATLVSQAERNFSHYPFIEYRTLNIDANPAEQGFDPHVYDLIVASDVLHATPDLRRTVSHVAQLLASEGTLVLLEAENAPLPLTLVFGMLKGWWLSTDSELRPDEPLITHGAWRRLLAESGFEESIAITDSPTEEQAIHAVIVARGPSIDATSSMAVRDRRDSWLVFADRAPDGGLGVGEAVAASLGHCGQDVVMAYAGTAFGRREDGAFVVAPGTPADIDRLFDALPCNVSDLAGIVHLWSLEAPASDEADGDEMERAWRVGLMSGLQLAQALGARSGSLPPLWLVTRGAQAVGGDPLASSVAQSVVWGLGATVVNECPQFRTHLVDLGTGGPEEIRSLVDELLDEDDEDQIALRGDARYIRRLLHLPKADDAPVIARAATPRPDFRIEAVIPGILDTLGPREMTRRPPGPGEVQIEVVAAALNFKDVMMAMALLPPEATRGGYSLGKLGLECSGRITAVGDGVHGLREGDAVLASGSGCLASHMTVDARFVVRNPGHLSFEECATIPVAFLTAYYSLHKLARVQPGERVLIHAGSGGVGLAAIQLAQRAGAEVFATVGNRLKRDLLTALGVRHVMNSRTVAFADEVLEITGGEGVDIVLNSLSGEAIPKSLSILRHGGRFVELGKRDIYENSRISLRPFGDNVSFSSVDLDRVTVRRPEIMRAMFAELMTAFENKELHPLQYRLFPLHRVATAFRHLAQAQHVGKVVISFEDTADALATRPTEPFRARADGSYLITGGLGGFGLAVAHYLVDRGARHLVLAGRRGPATPDIADDMESLARKGAHVTLAALDVTSERQVGDLLASIRASGAPLRGIIHAAMVLDDTLVQNMTQDQMWRVLLPKALGAWHLHRLTKEDPLDLFVMFSSFTSLIGNPGQANYVAGNAFLDELAHYRRSRGLPALTINWGWVAGAGYVARNRDVEERAERLGMKSQPMQQLLAAFGQLLESGAVQAGVALIDWRRVRQLFGSRIPARLSTLVTAAGADESSADHVALHTILDAAPTERPALIEGYIRNQLARVLGTAASKIEVDHSLLSLGLDSLMAVEMRNRVQTEFGVDIPPLKFMEGISISGVATFVAEQLAAMHPTAAKGTRRVPIAADQPPVEVAVSVDELSDDEVDRRLRTLIDTGARDAELV